MLFSLLAHVLYHMLCVTCDMPKVSFKVKASFGWAFLVLFIIIEQDQELVKDIKKSSYIILESVNNHLNLFFPYPVFFC